MRPLFLSCLIGATLAGFAPPTGAAGIREGYPGPDAVSAELRKLAGSLPGGSLIDYGTSAGGKKLQVLRVARGSGDPETKPALLVAAGADPERLASAEIALSIARTLGAKPASGADPLERAVLYVIADMNPDARAALLSGDRRGVNRRAVDEDHDGATDEDGPDDLDGDGHALWMRVYRSGGLFRPDTSDARANVKAAPEKGEFGVFDLLPEGRDDDRDGEVNEDGPGGVYLNANFPHGYEPYRPTSGPHQISEPESKAFADFVLAHPHIAAAIVFAGDDVLIEAPKGVKPEPTRGGFFGFQFPPGTPENIRTLLRDRSAVKGILDNDAPYYARAAERYKEQVGLVKEDPAPKTAGTIGDWLRHHQGMFALVTPGWTFPDSAGTPKKEGAKAGDDADGGAGSKPDGGAAGDDALKPDGGAPNDDAPKPGAGGKDMKKKKPETSREVRMLRYLADTGRDGFAPWKAVTHPTFPGRKVETGGLDPLAFLVPPRGDLDSLGIRHARFAAEVLSWLPGITLDTPVVDRLDGGAYRIRTEVTNTEYLPTALDQGVRTRKARPVRVDVTLPKGAVILTGRPVSLLYQIEGGGARRALEWTIQAAAGSRVTITAAAPRTGTTTQEVTLP